MVGGGNGDKYQGCPGAGGFGGGGDVVGNGTLSTPHSAISLSPYFRPRRRHPNPTHARVASTRRPCSELPTPSLGPSLPHAQSWSVVISDLGPTSKTNAPTSRARPTTNDNQIGPGV